MQLRLTLLFGSDEHKQLKAQPGPPDSATQ